MPQLSVIVPTYQSAGTLETCLKAVRASTFRDYELIVVDCGSQDATRSIAGRYANRVFELDGTHSRSAARNRGLTAAEGAVIVNIDSDVVIRPETLGRIADYFSRHQEIDALTGLLSKEQPHLGFFSQYKNLYMHYTFQRLPDRVTFLYGSIHALRREAARPYGLVVRIADDTALGQQLVSEGRRIAFVKALDVIHLRRYEAWSLIKNDFRIARDWARIFVVYQGWRQVGRSRTGFAHAPIEQLVSVVLAPATSLSGLLTVAWPAGALWTVGLAVLWLLLNSRFMMFLAREKGMMFGLLGCAWTFLDQVIMATGIICGFVRAALPGGPPPQQATAARAPTPSRDEVL